MDDDLLETYRSAVVIFVRRFICGPSAPDVAEEVGQQMVIEAITQDRTRLYLTEHIDQVRRKRVPGRNLKKRAHHLARALGIAADRGRDTGDIQLVEDKHRHSDHARLDAKLVVEDLAAKDPRIARMKEAYDSGCETTEQVAAFMGVSVRSYYELRRDLRKAMADLAR